MDPDIKIGIIQLTSNDNLQDNCNQMDYYFNQCLKDGADFILSPEVSNFISTNRELKKKSIKLYLLVSQAGLRHPCPLAYPEAPPVSKRTSDYLEPNP